MDYTDYTDYTDLGATITNGNESVKSVQSVGHKKEDCDITVPLTNI